MMKLKEILFPYCLGINPRRLLPLTERMESSDSPFCRSLVSCGYLSDSQMRHAASRYKLGMSRFGATVFWQTDADGGWVNGRVVYMLDDTHADPELQPQLVSTVLMLGDPQLAESWQPRCSLFGLHLADGSRPVAVVAEERTAVICSELLPEMTWVATAGMERLSAELLLPLRGQRVMVFPDASPDGSTYRRWLSVCNEASQLLHQPLNVSTLVERRATEEQKQRRVDLADLLVCSH